VAAQTNAADAAFDKAGRLVIAGLATDDTTYDTTNGFLARIGPDGKLDTSFGQNGFIVETRPDRRLSFETVEIDQQGRYVVGAFAETPPPDRFKYLAMSRYSVTYPGPPTTPTAKCLGKKATIIGTAKRDKLKGTGKRDVIAGLGGNDVIRGLGGNDLICGGAGNDTLVGGPGSDALIGGPGADKLNGGPGKDKLVGGPGRDRITGGKGRDRCLAGPGKKQRLTGCERRR
jgi:hypothetical protein